MDIRYTDTITAEAFNVLREAVGALPIVSEQVLAGIQGSAFIVTAMDGCKVVGFARLIWDGGYSAFIKNVMVLPEYEGHGIGSAMVRQIMDFLRNQMKPGYVIAIDIMATQGKEGFWSRLGFHERTKEHGSGMEHVIKIPA